MDITNEEFLDKLNEALSKDSWKPMNYGWICPICGAVMSPTAQTCINWHSNNNWAFTTYPHYPYPSYPIVTY